MISPFLAGYINILFNVTVFKSDIGALDGVG